MDRRRFIKTAAVASVAASMPSYFIRRNLSETVPKRHLGRTGEQLSIIGFGGIGVMRWISPTPLSRSPRRKSRS